MSEEAPIVADPWPPLREVVQRVRTAERPAVSWVRQAMARIARLDGRLGAVLHVDAEGALAQAVSVDRAVASGRDPGPLAGVPVLLKDNLCTRGVPTTCGSRLLAGWIPPYDATVVRRLREAGAVLLGKANLDEFAMGSSGEHSAFGPTRHPLAPERVPGGSSSGSAAAVAAGLVPAALGSDTGGSVRLPAAFCGVVGLKPSYGRVSRYGLVAFGSSLDQVGPLAARVEDAAALLAAIAGPDPRDATTASASTDSLAAWRDGAVPAPCPDPPRALVLSELFDAADSPVRDVLREGLDALVAAGWRIESARPSLLTEGLAVYYVISSVEAASNLARFDAVRYGRREPAPSAWETSARSRTEGFGEEVRRRILLGTFAASEGLRDRYYGRAQRLRAALARGLRDLLERADVLLAPSTPSLPFRLGERLRDPIEMYRTDLCALPASLAGLPAISVPAGVDPASGLPVGLQILGRPFGESALLGHAVAASRLLTGDGAGRGDSP